MSRVLVVDDTAVVARLLMVTLMLDGHEVTEITDDFAQLFTPAPWQGIDVLVCDVRMPDISGVDVLNYCADHHPNIFRVAITGSFDWTDETTKKAGSASDLLLRKPDDVHRLVDVLRDNGR